MAKINLDKNSKIPFYLQIKDRFIYLISTGEIKISEKLPKLIDLSKELEVSYETVRRAYQELEREGLISISRGKRTSVAPLGSKQELILPNSSMSRHRLEEIQKTLLQAFIRIQIKPQEIKDLIKKQLREVTDKNMNYFIIFSECSDYQTREIANVIETEIGLHVKPVVLKEIEQELQKLQGNKNLLAVITTGFHFKKVHDLATNYLLDVYALSINMSPQSRRILYSHKNASFGIICRDKGSLQIYEDYIKNEIGNNNINISGCIFSEKDKVREILSSVDVVLVTPPVYQNIKKHIPKKLILIKMFDQVDQMSLDIIKEQIQRKLTQFIFPLER